MSFQWIINVAESISIDKKKMVAVTTARDGTTRAVSRGNMYPRITVKVPDGMLWTDLRTAIQAAEALDRISTAIITIEYSRFPWYYGNTSPPGGNESYRVRCIEFPQWTITGQNQVSWSGPFVFQEATL